MQVVHPEVLQPEPGARQDGQRGGVVPQHRLVIHRSEARQGGPGLGRGVVVGQGGRIGTDGLSLVVEEVGRDAEIPGAGLPRRGAQCREGAVRYGVVRGTRRLDQPIQSVAVLPVAQDQTQGGVQPCEGREGRDPVEIGVLGQSVFDVGGERPEQAGQVADPAAIQVDRVVESHFGLGLVAVDQAAAQHLDHIPVGGREQLHRPVVEHRQLLRLFDQADRVFPAVEVGEQSDHFVPAQPPRGAALADGSREALPPRKPNGDRFDGQRRFQHLALLQLGHPPRLVHPDGLVELLLAGLFAQRGEVELLQFAPRLFGRRFRALSFLFSCGGGELGGGQNPHQDVFADGSRRAAAPASGDVGRQRNRHLLPCDPYPAAAVLALAAGAQLDALYRLQVFQRAFVEPLVAQRGQKSFGRIGLENASLFALHPPGYDMIFPIHSASFSGVKAATSAPSRAMWWAAFTS